MTPLPRHVRLGYTETTKPMALSPVVTKSVLTIVGGALASAATVLPPPWATIALLLGGFLSGGALVKRPGDISVKAPKPVKL